MANVDSSLKNWSTTALSNQPDNADAATVAADLREIQAAVRGDLATKGADIVSAATTDLGAVQGLFHDITGSTGPITSFGTVSAGIWKVIKFEGTPTITHNAASLILPGGANIVAANGDIMFLVSEGVGNWRCVDYIKASAAPITLSPITNSLSGDVLLNNTGTYFTGPTIAQGTAGTWFVSGTVLLTDSAGSATVNVKLWDGTTVIASANGFVPAATGQTTVSLSGYISSPAGNLRMSVKDVTSTSGTMLFNASGNSKDSTISAIRIA